MELKLYLSKDIKRARWDKFIDESPEGMVYAYAEFLDGMAAGWGAYVIEEQGEWQMVFPFKRSKRYGLSYFLQPKFTQFLGPAFRPFSGKSSKEMQWKNKALTLLCDRIKSDFKYVNFNMHPGSDYNIPFVWSKFRVTPKFTNQIQLKGRELADIESEIHKGKIQVNKAEQAGFGLSETDSPKRLLDLFFALKNDQIKHLGKEDYLEYGKVVEKLIAGEHARVFEMSSADGDLAGGMILYTYKGVLTYAFSVADPKFAKQSIGHALIWEAIKFGLSHGQEVLDFEGSMIPEIERVFRRFGATPETYFNVQHAKFGFLYRS